MKRGAKSSTTLLKKAHSLKPFNFGVLLPRSKKSIFKTVAAFTLLIMVIGAVPMPYTFAKSSIIPFHTDKQQSTELELNDSKVIQEGTNGTKVVQIKSLQSLWGRIFGLKPTQQKEEKSTISKTPVNKIVANGTIKYQYMLCSNGTFQSYTDEQFKEPQNGFTNKSLDYCKENKQGQKLSLSNSNPSNTTTLSASRPTSTKQPDTYEADKINREVDKLRWCSEQDGIIGNEYIGKVHQAQSKQGISNEEFNSIVDPAYFQYSNQVNSLRAAGCTISVAYPNYDRQ